jgi:hypothetical protein
VTPAVIDERHRAYFGVGIRRDSDGTARLDLAIPSPELGAAAWNSNPDSSAGLGSG